MEILVIKKYNLREKYRFLVTSLALSAFVDKTQEYVTGTVKLKLYKGNIIPAGMTSPYTLYSEELATFDESDYDQKDSAGFINLWGLPTTVQALREQGKLK